MNSTEIRRRFFDFFVKNGHEKVASSSLIPAQDPTLLFANAGMNQFKDLFLGLEKRSYSRAVSIQKCVRAGGKHNDLDNVGFTKRHLTFFEMMGNFSFGDYFKIEAIQFAWDFLTKELGLPVDNLHVSVYLHDQESYDIWNNMMGVPTEKIHKLGAEENFWQMGDTGPCGPCTEIHVDRGPGFGCEQQCSPACDCDRFLEVWNVVFMQFERQPNGTDKPLTQTGVDTGMGLERICSVMQDKDSVFETDLFANILKKIEELTGVIYEKQTAQTKAAFHVLADHIRSSSFLIADGCAPSNEGRGYVLRKIIRRAALFAQKLSDKNIFPELSLVVVEDMRDIYPELKANATHIYKLLSSEIEKFSANLTRGRAILEQYFIQNQDTKIINGEQTFKLYDTFGFPIELIHVMAREHDFTVDTDAFEVQMQKQKEQSGKKTTDELDHIEFDTPISSQFTGYQELETESTIIGLVHNNESVIEVPAGETCWVIAEQSPFFIVGGGQVPDNGWLKFNNLQAELLHVKFIGKAIAVQIQTPTALTVGMPVTSIVNKQLRVTAMKNHTATHMLQSALIEILGKQIKQSGSLVHPDYLRFDFTYHENLSPEQIEQVENRVNEKIMENIPVTIEYNTMKEATKRGALAFFGDKYNPEQVRIVGIDDYSVELCGGTHVPATGVIGAFKITDVTALSAGHRRIFAVTGPKALELFQQSFSTVKTLSQEFKIKREHVLDAVEKQQEHIKSLESNIKQLRKQNLKTQLPVWLQSSETINDIPFLFLHLNDVSAEELREIAGQLTTAQPGFYFLISANAATSSFIASLSAKLADAVDMQKFGSWLKEAHGLRGGGSKSMIQGGGGSYDPILKTTMIEWMKKQ
ncbi:MAG TPA: alanine--tRNA ligase [Candidatus Babeliales bacterium]|nr:alanine--tRNA ligase [Candidatus Babeliales bacterium]